MSSSLAALVIGGPGSALINARIPDQQAGRLRLVSATQEKASRSLRER